MIALLQASGYTAQYVYGTMKIPGTDLESWLGVQTPQAEGNVLANAGIPVQGNTIGSDGTATLNRVWVQATINGAAYQFDPAFKTYTYYPQINIGKGLGYGLTSFIGDATTGATIGAGPVYVKNLNNANIGKDLASYTMNLVSVLRNAQYANLSFDETIGGRQIVQTILSGYTTTLPFSATANSTWSSIPSQYESTIEIKFPDAGLDYTTNTSNLGGSRLTITYTATNHQPQLTLDGTIVATGTATAAGSRHECDIKLTHPYQGSDQTAPYPSVVSGSTYAVVYDFGGVNDSLIRQREKLLSTCTNQGLNSRSEPVLGETLNIMGLTWLKEVGLVDRLLSYVTGTVSINHHRVGLMADESAEGGGYYVDVRAAMSSIVSQHGVSSDEVAHFKEFGLVASAFEHGMLEQLMGSSHLAASTMKLFQVANDSGVPIYLVDSSTTYSSVKPLLQNYSTADLNTNFPNLLAKGDTLILPANGQLPVDKWKGEGYISKLFQTGNWSMGMIIGGGYSGGYGGEQIPVSTPQVQQVATNNSTANISPATVQLSASLANTVPLAAEPVEMAGGAFLQDHTDLALGPAAPLGLAFSRSYDSSLNLVNRAMGYGWSNGYDIYITPTSDGNPGLGMRQAVDAAPMIAALYVATDLLKNQDTLQAWVTASLASKWAVDQLIDNAETVNFGKKVMEYIRLPNGSYSPPPGVTTQAVKNGDGTFSLHERFGTVLNFNANNQIGTITDVDGNTMSFGYSGSNPVTVTDAFGRRLTLNYSSGLLTSVVDSSSPARSVSFGYDSSKNLTSFTDPDGYTWRYGYDANHLMTSIRDPAGNTTITNGYDSLGRVDSQVALRQGGATATYQFYFSGYQNMQVDPKGRITAYYFDDQGRDIAEIDPLGDTTGKSYDGQDHVISTVDPKGGQTLYGYDAADDLTSVTNALNGKTTYGYDAQFNRTDVTDPLGHDTHSGYDAKHHVVDTIDAMNDKTRAAYNSRGLPSSSTDARGTVTNLAYDGYGAPATIQTGAHSQLTETHYATGLLDTLTDQGGSQTSFVYNNRGLLLSMTDPFGKVGTMAYDADGRTLHKTDRDGNTITYSYTPDGKIDTITYPNSSTVKFSYDIQDNDNLAHIDDSTGRTSYTYDADGRVLSITDPFGFTVSYGYDAAGNVASLTYPGGKKVNYTYDALNRIENVRDWLGQTATYTYDSAGRCTALTNFNGTKVVYAYDNANRLTGETVTNSGGTAIVKYSFTLDANGNRIGETRSAPLLPTPASQLVSYSYTSTGNRLVSVGGSSFAYDADGQLKTGYGSNYTFDYEHRLMGAGAVHYTYNGTGNRVQMVNGTTTTRYVLDAKGNVLAVADGNNQVTGYFIYGAGLLEGVTSAGAAYCYHFDANANTIALTDSSENVVDSYAYDPFGSITGQVESVPQPFKFVGRFGVIADPNGFYYMRARYYDPAVGRFVSEDPSGFSGGDVNLDTYVNIVGKPQPEANLYLYASANPVIFIDPYGLRDWNMIGGGAIVLVNGVGQFFAGGALAYVGFAEADSVLFAPAALHTIGLGGTLMATGVTTGAIGWNIISKAWDNNGATQSPPSSQISAQPPNVINSPSSGYK